MLGFKSNILEHTDKVTYINMKTESINRSMLLRPTSNELLEEMHKILLLIY